MKRHQASPDGLILSGKVTARSRRNVPANDPKTEIVTYVVQDEVERKYYVDDYAPSSYHDIGDQVVREVYVKAYRKKNGEPSYSLNVQKEFQGHPRGESF